MQVFGLTPSDAPIAVIHQTHPVDKKYVMGGGKSGTKSRGGGRPKLSEESIKSMVSEESIKSMVGAPSVACLL
jgi:hypothetical protein